MCRNCHNHEITDLERNREKQGLPDKKGKPAFFITKTVLFITKNEKNIFFADIYSRTNTRQGSQFGEENECYR